MPDFGHEHILSELQAQIEPTVKESVTRLALAHSDLESEVHKVFPKHSDDEHIWVTECGPHLRGESRFRTGIHVLESGEILLSPPTISKKHAFVSRLYVDPLFLSQKDAVTDTLMAATSIEELVRQLRLGHAWPEVRI